MFWTDSFLCLLSSSPDVTYYNISHCWPLSLKPTGSDHIYKTCLHRISYDEGAWSHFYQEWKYIPPPHTLVCWSQWKPVKLAASHLLKMFSPTFISQIDLPSNSFPYLHFPLKYSEYIYIKRERESFFFFFFLSQVAVFTDFSLGTICMACARIEGIMQSIYCVSL